MQQNPLPRLDTADEDFRARLLPFCRLRPGEFWIDPQGKHTVGCGDASDRQFLTRLVERDGTNPPVLAVHDPPYNMVMNRKGTAEEFADWCRGWVEQSYDLLNENAALYLWIGADQNDHFQPLGQVLSMMSGTGFKSRSLVTMRNQRGYGTQKNWMSVRQELLYYTKGDPNFEVQYTDIPRILGGYYKDVGGKRRENSERSRSECIRPGNVWVDIQQVFYRMEENISGCYAQKPLKAIRRIIAASSKTGDTVLDFFAHSGTTLLACEQLDRCCRSCDLDPIFAEITIRRLEHFRATGQTGWQASNPFENELNNKSAVVDTPILSGVK